MPLSNLQTRKKTPKQDRANVTRKKLLKAAIACFSDYGFEATSIRMIAQKADVSFQLISYHFGSKDDLWRASVNEMFSRASERFRSSFDEIKSVPAEQRREKFRDYLYIFLGANIQNPQMRKMITHEYMANSDRYRNILKPIWHSFLQEYGGRLNELIDLGIITRYSAEELMMIIPSMAQSNALARYEMEEISGYPLDSSAYLDWQVGILMKIIFGDDVNDD